MVMPRVRNTKTPASLLCAVVVLLLTLSRPATGLDSLAVGQISPFSWTSIADWPFVERVNVTPDSVFKWDVAANTNLGPGVLDRGGRVIATYEMASGDSTILVVGGIPGLDRLVDGDDGTAFSPDDSSSGGVPRRLTVEIDLGAVFRVNRIRLFPRLDREHRVFFPQLFRILTSEDPADQPSVEAQGTRLLKFGSFDPNQEPLMDRQFASREARFVTLAMDGTKPWELAEVEIFSDGTVPRGRFQSVPLLARRINPVWGRVRYEGGDVTDLPVLLQTRTGPDANPILYFRRTGVGDDVEVVRRSVYDGLLVEERGPVRANPDWSQWSMVTDGLVRSPSFNRFLQFRITFPEPGTAVRRLVFEYTSPPLVEELKGEIDPRLVSAGREETFTLSILAHMLTERQVGRLNTTGFQRMQVLTSAEVAGVDRVLVDDREIFFTAVVTSGEGFTVSLGQRIVQDGTFLQIVFRGTVFRDGTRFDVRALDLRVVDRRLEEVYQAALEADVDPVSPGGDLVVRIEKTSSALADPLIEPALFTPNGDGLNEAAGIAFDLLKLTRAAVVEVQVFDLSGRLVRRLFAGKSAAGHYAYDWDGRDDGGELAPPGSYVCRVLVEADDGKESWQQVVGVVY